MRDVAAADDFALHDVIGFVGFGDEEVDGFALEEGEEQILGHGIVAVVLLEDLEVGLAGGIAQDDGVGFEMRGGVREADVIDAALEVERDGVADDGEVLVIDGERGIGEQRRSNKESRGQEENAKVHGRGKVTHHRSRVVTGL